MASPKYPPQDILPNTTSQRAITAAIRLLEAEGYTVSRKADPTAWDYTLVRKYQPNQTAAEVPALRDL